MHDIPTRQLTMNNHSCIKIPPGPKESIQNPNASTRDVTELRDQLCSRNDLISMANEVFGVDKWSHAVTSQNLDFVEYVTGKYYVGCAAFVKVQLKDGTFHEDLGYSNTDGPSKGLAIFSARAGSITNALKSTLLCFGGDMATKIQTFNKSKTVEPCSMISTIGEPQRLVPSKEAQVPTPQAASTPKRIHIPLISVAPSGVAVENNKAVSLPPNGTEKKSTMSSPKPVPEEVKIIDRAAMTEEERRIERKRRQAQKQEEYRKHLKSLDPSDKPNPRF